MTKELMVSYLALLLYLICAFIITLHLSVSSTFHFHPIIIFLVDVHYKDMT